MPNSPWRIILIAVVSVALAAPARAESLDTAGKQIVAGIVVVSAALAVGVTLLILHEKHKITSITGCVSSGPGLMNISDDKDKRIYKLTGDPVGIKVGNRMTLEGKRRKEGETRVFQAHSVTQDFGPCQP